MTTRGRLSSRFLAPLVTALVVVGAGLVAPSGAVTASTRVTGFPTGSATVEAGVSLPITVRVRGPESARRVTQLQVRPAAGTRWTTAAATTTSRSGVARLLFTAPDRAGVSALRVRVPARRGAPGAVSGVLRLSVTTPEPGPTPEPTPEPGSGDEAAEVVDLVNRARDEARSCGADTAPAVSLLTRESRLDRAAQAYAERMAREHFFAHQSPDGDGPGDRITAEGYVWSAYGENIAAGQATAAAVMAAWLASPGHCRNIMSPSVTQVGVGVARDPSSPYGIYWVQVFARPR